ncbi:MULTISPECIES: histidine phosphatase family protein [unclassified Streptomyces]|uniref:histidine phosphatase family protein n=1 Tax=unclassified Streptomyces TaxID=2593676 RepID=UPI00378A8397
MKCSWTISAPAWAPSGSACRSDSGTAVTPRSALPLSSLPLFPETSCSTPFDLSRREFVIALLRHGQTCGNVSKASYMDVSEDDMLLTEQGRAETEELAKALAELGSPSGPVLLAPERRCEQSAVLLGLEQRSFRTDPRLRSQSWGTFDFPGARELLTRSKTWPSGLDVRFAGGETSREVYDRCRPVAEELRSAELAEPGVLSAVVTHGVVIKLLLAHWSSWPDATIEGTRSISTGSGVTVTFSKDDGSVRYESLPRA